MRVLITGANRGIGAELHDRYRARGDQVIGTTRAAGAGAGWITLDVAEAASVAALADQVNDPLDLLVANAGVYLDKGHDLESGYPVEAWAETFSVNVTGVFLTIRALLPQLRAARGRIAIVSSQMASQERAPGGSYIYRASKAAALNLGRNLARDLAPDGIAVGMYHPGWVQTDMGGAAAEITVAEAADGLVARFDELSVAESGCFRTWDGRDHPL